MCVLTRLAYITADFDAPAGRGRSIGLPGASDGPLYPLPPTAARHLFTSLPHTFLSLHGLLQYDTVVLDALETKVTAKANLKGHLDIYRYCDNVRGRCACQAVDISQRNDAGRQDWPSFHLQAGHPVVCLQVWTFILSDATFRLAPSQVRVWKSPATPAGTCARTAGCCLLSLMLALLALKE